MDAREIAERLAAAGEWTFSRSSGPGGQRRDHAETRAGLTIRADDLAVLPEPVAERLRAGLALDARPLRLSSQAGRERERNRQLVLARLTARVAGALAPPSPPRRATAPSRGARERRLAEKTRRARLKAARQRPADDA